MLPIYSFINLFISIYSHAAYIFNIRKVMKCWGTKAAKAQKKSYMSMNIDCKYKLLRTVLV